MSIIYRSRYSQLKLLKMIVELVLFIPSLRSIGFPLNHMATVLIPMVFLWQQLSCLLTHQTVSMYITVVCTCVGINFLKVINIIKFQ